MRIIFKEHGIVSVFLAIILIPCIVVSSLFVDISRIVLSKGPASSAAELALNSLMSNYDADLADLYGLFGSCQTISDYYQETEEYFVNALQSKGLSDDDIDTLLGYFMSTFNSDDVADLLAIESKGNPKGGSIVSAVPDTALNNPVIIEDQIVDFMKYRAPVSIATGIMDRLKKSGAKEAFGNADEDEELVDAKDEFAEEADDLSRQLYYANERIKDYNKNNLKIDDLQKICDDLVKYRELYREINLKIISNLHGTSHLNSSFTRYTVSLNNYVNTYKKGTKTFKNKKYKLYSSTKKDESGKTVYIINEDYMIDRIEDLENKKAKFVEAKNAIINSVGKDLINADVGTGANQVSPIQWWKNVNSKLSWDNYKSTAKNMLISYAKLLAATSCEIDEEYQIKWTTTDETRCTKILNDVKSVQGKYLVSGKIDNDDNYLKLVNKLESVSSQYQTQTQSGSVLLSNGKTIGTTVAEISTSLKQYKKQLEDIIYDLDVIIYGDGGDDWDFLDDYKGLDKLDDYADDYHKSFKNWSNVANEKKDTSTLAQADVQEIKEHKEEYSQVTKESVTQLETRFKNIKSQVQEVYDEIDKMTYGGKKLIDISDYSTAYNAVSSKIGSVPGQNSAISSHAESVFKQVFSPYSSNTKAAVHTLANKNNANYNPDLEVNKPSLYKFIQEEFKNVEKKSKEEREAKMDEIDNQDETNDSGDKTDADSQAARANNVSTTNIYGGNYTASEFPSKLTGKNKFPLGKSFFKGIVGVVTDLTSGKLTNSRDNIYLTEYCMNMFSYATYVNEGKRKLYEEKNPDAQLTLKDYKNGVYTGASITGNADTRNTWLSNNICDTYNQSLTNHKINAANNVAFGAEVEYILYGNTNKKNVSSAYVDIFAVRYPLNLVSGFMYLWNGTKNNTALVIETTANSLSAATSGVVPAFFIKTVIIALLTAAETLHDLDVLEAGLSVPVFKVIKSNTDSDWYYNIKMGELSKNSSGNENAGKGKAGLYYSDYLYLFLMLGFQGGPKNAMLKRMGDVIQANMRLANDISDYQLSKSITYFQINTTIDVQPLMLNLAFANSYSNNPKNNESLFSYEIKEIRGYS